MSLRCALIVCFALQSACDSRPRNDAPDLRTGQMQALPGALERSRLGEWFSFAGVRCRASRLTQHLSERAPRRADVRVARDVRTLSVALACERPGRGAVDAESVLAQGAAVTLLGPDGRVHPALLGNRADREALAEPKADAKSDAPETEATLSFELDPRAPLARARRLYDARDGSPRPAAHDADYTLSLARERERVDTLLRYRFEGPALDTLLNDVLARLVRGAGFADLPGSAENVHLGDVQRAYAALAKRYAPRALRVEVEPASDDTLSVHIALAELTRRTSSAEALRITLHVRTDGAGFRVLDAVNPNSLERAVHCASLEEAMTDALREALPEAGQANADCSVLGVRVPMPCDDVPARLRNQAFRVGEECAAAPLPAVPGKTPPDDFQVVLRHGRGSRTRASARDARSTLVIFGNGNVVFHAARESATDARRDGRTPKELVARLYAMLESLSWFERRGGQFDAEHCGPSATDGEVITVVARGRERMVVNRNGCRGPFSSEDLDGLVLQVVTIGGERGFTAARPSYRDPQVKVWTVPAD